MRCLITIADVFTHRKQLIQNYSCLIACHRLKIRHTASVSIIVLYIPIISLYNAMIHCYTIWVYRYGFVSLIAFFFIWPLFIIPEQYINIHEYYSLCSQSTMFCMFADITIIVTCASVISGNKIYYVSNGMNSYHRAQTTCFRWIFLILIVIRSSPNDVLLHRHNNRK